MRVVLELFGKFVWGNPALFRRNNFCGERLFTQTLDGTDGFSGFTMRKIFCGHENSCESGAFDTRSKGLPDIHEKTQREGCGGGKVDNKSALGFGESVKDRELKRDGGDGRKADALGSGEEGEQGLSGNRLLFCVYR